MKPISEINSSDLEEYVFPGTDAAVLIVDQKLTQKNLEEMFGEISGQHRFYATDKGWEIKFPYWYISELLKNGGAGFKEEDFKKEKKGWDHEHCSFCHEHVHIGDLSYTTEHEDGGFYIVCPKCSVNCKKKEVKPSHPANPRNAGG